MSRTNRRTRTRSAWSDAWLRRPPRAGRAPGPKVALALLTVGALVIFGYGAWLALGPMAAATQLTVAEGGLPLRPTLTLSFSGAVSPDSVMEALRTDPPFRWSSAWSGSDLVLQAEERLRPQTTYFLKLRRGAKDRHGRPLMGVRRWAFTMPPLDRALLTLGGYATPAPQGDARPFTGVSDLVSGAHAAWCMLRPDRPDAAYLEMAATALRDAGFSAVGFSLGAAADLQTLEVFQQRDLAATAPEPMAGPAIVDLGGFAVGFLALDTSGATPDAVRQARHLADILAVVVDSGPDPRATGAPAPAQRSLAKSLLDAGADLVVMDVAAAPMGVEVYRERAIIYGLGPLATAAPWNIAGGRYSVLALVTTGASGVEALALVPLDLAGGVPSELAGDQARVFLDSLGRQSQSWGTKSIVAGSRLQISGLRPRKP